MSKRFASSSLRSFSPDLHVGEPDACLDQAESYTTPWLDQNQGKAGRLGVADPSPDNKTPPPHAMKLADSYIDPQEGALLAQDALVGWLDRYRLELDSETEQVIYESILDTLKRADLRELE